MAQAIVQRVQRLLLSPKSEWDVIDKESVEPQSLLFNYVAPLAAIPAVAGAIGMTVFGVSAFGVTVRTPLFSAIGAALSQFVLALVGVYVLAYVINWLAPRFGAQINFGQAFKAAAYSPTAAWVAGASALIPNLAVIGAIGAVYTLYLFFVGVPKMMKPAEGKATTYTIVSILAAIVVWIVLGLVVACFSPKPGLGNFGTTANVSGPTGQALRDLEQRAEAANEALESGDYLSALQNLQGDEVAVVDMDALRDFAPESFAGMPRESIQVQSLPFPAQAVELKARYAQDQDYVELSIANTPLANAVKGLAGIALAQGGEYDRRTEDGYERLERKNGGMVLEEWRESLQAGKYARLVGDMFLVTVEGRGVAMDDIKKAGDSIRERDLNRLPKKEG